MQIDIVDFLPKYPNINKLKEEIFNPYDEDFYENIYKKKEFYDNKLPEVEEFPQVVGTLMKHQKLIANFFSSNTIYDELLLLHEMGSGKTCSAIGAVEQIRSEGGGFRGALYLAKGEALINNFVNELIFKCTDGLYIPENYDDLTEGEKNRRKKKAIREYYKLNTFETFAKDIKRNSDVELQKMYNNTIIIIDEVHNLRIQSKETGLNIYNQFYRFLHTVQDCKILLMSGTPMKDSVEEIASVMNLILPKDNKLPTGSKFLEVFFDSEAENEYRIKSDHIDKLKDVFKGRVSYLKAMQSKIKKVFAGDNVQDLKHFKVVTDSMSLFQNDAYNIAYEIDRTEKKGVYSKSRQATLFVFPDGSYGDEGFKKYIIKKPTKNIFIKKGNKKKTFVYTMTNGLRDALNGKDNKERLEKLEKYSSKYAISIRNILHAQNEGKCVFLYNEYVQGSGLILFGLILELFGFSSASGKETKNSEKPRYASLTNLTSTNNQLKKIVDRFNQADNMNGKIINVIMGSRKISEGFSLQNIQIEEIHTPWYNYSETSQAIARGYRLGSHRVLLNAGVVPLLTIYQRVSLSSSDKPSIDLEMYKISEIKDISIKLIERLMKISAWDCLLNYDRNHTTGYDGQRDCDYTDCDYVCDGIIPELIETDYSDLKLDNSTFQIYYNYHNVDKIINDIILLFKDNFQLRLESIFSYFPTYSKFDVITVLHKMINESTPIINRYGFSSYIKEERNIFFLVDSLSVIGNYSSDYYTEFPNVKVPITFNKVVQPLYILSFPKIIEEVCKVSTLEQLRKLLIRLPIEVHSFLLESSILAQKLNITHNKSIRDIILKYFENYYADFDDVWICWLLFEDQEILRCLEDKEWKNCSEEYIERYENYKKKSQMVLENNPYGFYGQFNRATKDFCIRDVSENIPDKKHQRTSGKRCINWKKQDLIPIILNILKIPIPDDSKMEIKELNKWKKIKKFDKTKLLNEILKNKYVKKYHNTKLSENDLLRILFWGKQQLKPLCTYLQDWFESKKILVEDSGCGQIGKQKI